MISDQPTIIAIGAIAIVVLELWRRSLRGRAPRWVHACTFALLAGIAAGVAYSRIALGHAWEAAAAEEGGNKASVLASRISTGLDGDVAALACILITVAVLGISAWRARSQDNQR